MASGDLKLNSTGSLVVDDDGNMLVVGTGTDDDCEECCFPACPVCPGLYPDSVTVTLSGVVLCECAGFDGVCLYTATNLTGVNGTFVVPLTGLNPAGLTNYELVGVGTYDFPNADGDCEPVGDFCTGHVTCRLTVQLRCIDGILNVRAVSVQLYDCTESGPECDICGACFHAATFGNDVFSGGRPEGYNKNEVIPNDYDCVGATRCDNSCSNNVGADGTATVDWEDEDFEPANECTHCGTNPGCTQPDCGQCCTPDTIRATTSGVTVCFDTCIQSATQDWQLDGTTAVSGTNDLEQDATNKCLWKFSKSSDHVLKRATKTALSTLTYRATKTSATEWRLEVFAGATGIRFFDGTETVTSGNCTTGATASNSISAGCGTGGQALNTGSGGTFAITPVTVPTGTACGNCTVTTPSALDATIASVTSTLGACACSNGYRATGTTDPNRTITLAQTGNPCVFEATVASDFTLYDHTTPSLTLNIDTIEYRLTRTGATTATWAIIGISGGVDTITYASGTSAVSANNCKTWGTVTHASPSCSVNEATPTMVAGAGGSTTLAACP